MKYINIQLQPKKSSLVSKEDILFLLVKLGLSPEVSEGNDNGPYINILFRVNSIYQVWGQLESELLSCPGVRESSIITCEGSQGWGNYLLLHHFDSAEEIDNVPSNH